MCAGKACETACGEPRIFALSIGRAHRWRWISGESRIVRISPWRSAKRERPSFIMSTVRERHWRRPQSQQCKLPRRIAASNCQKPRHTSILQLSLVSELTQKCAPDTVPCRNVSTIKRTFAHCNSGELCAQSIDMCSAHCALRTKALRPNVDQK